MLATHVEQAALVRLVPDAVVHLGHVVRLRDCRVLPGDDDAGSITEPGQVSAIVAERRERPWFRAGPVDDAGVLRCLLLARALRTPIAHERDARAIRRPTHHGAVARPI